MDVVAANSPPAKPRWDGNRILFAIEVAGQSVPCGISRSALQDLSGRRQFAAAELLKSFAAVRPRIEALALRMFTERPESVSGILSIWTEDVDNAPAAAACAAP